MNLKHHITEVPNFPKSGVLFYDISPLLLDAKAWHYTIQTLAEKIKPYKPDSIAGVESRGFLLAAPLAFALGIGFVMVRKKGKLPGHTVSYTYNLEYGTDTLELQKDAVKQGQTVVVVDDLLATGGTLSATVKLLKNCGATVPFGVGIVELLGLGGSARLDMPFEALVAY